MQTWSSARTRKLVLIKSCIGLKLFARDEKKVA